MEIGEDENTQSQIKTGGENTTDEGNITKGS